MPSNNSTTSLSFHPCLPMSNDVASVPTSHHFRIPNRSGIVGCIGHGRGLLILCLGCRSPWICAERSSFCCFFGSRSCILCRVCLFYLLLYLLSILKSSYFQVITFLFIYINIYLLYLLHIFIFIYYIYIYINLLYLFITHIYNYLLYLFITHIYINLLYLL